MTMHRRHVCAAIASVALPARRARAIELAAPIDPLRRAVCAGRHFGDRGAHGGQRVDAPARPDRVRREQGRRRRRAGDAGGGQGRARRLHDHRRACRLAGRAPGHLSQPALRREPRFRAGDAAGQGAQPVRDPSRRAGQGLQGLRRVREGQSRQAQLRIGRQCQRWPPGDGVPQAGDRHVHDAHPVPRHRAGTDRSAGRPHPGVLGRHAGAAAAHQEPGGCARSRWAPRTACRCCPTCRRSPSRATRTSRPRSGTASWRRRARRARSSSGCRRSR